MSLETGASVEIHHSKFFYISNLVNGPVIYGNKAGAVVSIYDSEFYNNTSPQGGVFHADSRSLIK